jgi:hydrogenase/urease accessory protein HupE
VSGTRLVPGLALALVLAGAGASAHELRPAYLELRQLDATTWDLLFKVPARGERRLGLYVRLPDACTATEPAAHAVTGAHVERWRARCADGLAGRRVAIDGLTETRTDVLARVEHSDGSSQTARLTPDEPGFRVAGSATWIEVARTYFALGVEHILLGTDHLLFVLALLFLAGSWRRLVGTVSAFTVAHSVTLAAATLGWVYVPQAPVEAAIALSIVFVAAEVAHAAAGRPALAARKPWLVAFVFGLLHGLGFAGALRDVGLPEGAIPAALAFFNVGVEAGQLLFVAAVFGLVALVRALRTGAAADTWVVTTRLARPTAYAIGIPAAFWTLERTAGFWSPL